MHQIVGRLVGGTCLALMVVSCSSPSSLSNSDLSEAVTAMEEGTALPPGVEGEGDRLRVEMHHDIADREAVALIESMDGIVEGTSPGVVQALVPYQRLSELEDRPEVRFLRPPLRVDLPATVPKEDG